MSGRGGKRDHIGGAKEWRPFSGLGHRIGDDEPVWIPHESITGETASETRQGGAMMTARMFVREGHEKVLPDWLLDAVVEDQFLDVRMMRFRAQITLAHAIRQQLIEMGYPAAKELVNLRPLVQLCQKEGILQHKQANVLMRINFEGNEAKHQPDLPQPHA